MLEFSWVELANFRVSVSAESSEVHSNRMFYVCPPEFIRLGMSCYYFSKEAASWQNAHFACQVNIDNFNFVIASKLSSSSSWAKIHHVLQNKDLSNYLPTLSILNNFHSIHFTYLFLFCPLSIRLSSFFFFKNFSSTIQILYVPTTHLATCPAHCNFYLIRPTISIT